MDNYRNILITVAGSTPQILTETLYDFILQRKLSINEIVIITNKFGKKIFEKKLFDNSDGKFYQFCSEYGLLAYQFDVNFIVIKNRQDEQLQDIRSEEDNRDAANCIVRTIRSYAQDEKCRILASIAGGRKTMSIYMGYAMQLYARKQDRLFHVLVAPEILESNPFFYYPPKNEQDFSFKNKKGETITVPYDQIKISNAEIPFIRLREILPFIHGPQGVEYEDLVKLTQEEINQAFVPAIKVQSAKATVIIKWREQSWELKFKPMDFTFYWYLLEKRYIINSHDNSHSKALQELYLKVRNDLDPEDKNLLPAFTYKDLSDIRSRINRLIKGKIKFDKIHQFVIIHRTENHRTPTYYINSSLDEISLDKLLR